MKKRILSILLFTLIIAAISLGSFTVAADEGDELGFSVQPRFTYISSASATCSVSGTRVYSHVRIICSSTASSCKAQGKLYCRPAGSSNTWGYVTTYTGTGTDYAIASGERALTIGYEYRLKATVTAYASNGASESSTFYSKVTS